MLLYGFFLVCQFVFLFVCLFVCLLVCLSVYKILMWLFIFLKILSIRVMQLFQVKQQVQGGGVVAKESSFTLQLPRNSHTFITIVQISCTRLSILNDWEYKSDHFFLHCSFSSCCNHLFRTM